MSRHLELHVWGSAFGLPSLDPECLAAITYCVHALDESQWTLVPSSPSAVPTRKVAPVVSFSVYVCPRFITPVPVAALTGRLAGSPGMAILTGRIGPSPGGL
jgi:hypothetical protein